MYIIRKIKILNKYEENKNSSDEARSLVQMEQGFWAILTQKYRKGEE